ncbi:MAG: MBL fold metallo-hydrolase [Bacteroidota bacterium]
MKTTHLLLALLISSFSFSQNFDKVEIKKIEVSENIYMLVGAGGNIGVLTGEDGVLMVDSQYNQLSEKIQKAVDDITEKPIKFLVNTHWHFDHTGGNENFKNSEGSIIVAHENVYTRLQKEHFNEIFDWDIKAADKNAWPTITFTEEFKFHINGEDVNIFHSENAHTDGDAVVYFTKANVMHTGDVFVRYGFPFIDITVGGGIDGMIKIQKKILDVTNQDTKYIPGHGELASRADVVEVYEMLKETKEIIQKHKEKGKTLDEVLTAAPLKSYAERWNGNFISTELFTQFVYETL